MACHIVLNKKEYGIKYSKNTVENSIKIIDLTGGVRPDIESQFILIAIDSDAKRHYFNGQTRSECKNKMKLANIQPVELIWEIQ